MAVYFEPQRQEKSWMDGMNQALQIGLQYQMKQGIMDKRASLNDTSHQNRLNEQRAYDTNQNNIMFGTTLQNAGAGNQGSIKIDGRYNPQNTGMTEEAFNNMRMQADTGVKVPNPQKAQYDYQGGKVFKDGQATNETYKQKPQKPQFDYKGGIVFENGKPVGDYPLTPREKGETGTGTSAHDKRGVTLQKQIFQLNKQDTGIMAGTGIYEPATGARQKSLEKSSKDMMPLIYELHTNHPELYKQMYPTKQIRTGVNNTSGKKVIQFSDGTQHEF